MEIKSCYIENFGILSKRSFEFSEGLNVIEDDNGRGKTTLSVFIKSMFYGMEYSKKRKPVSERERYLPWQGGNYGGRLSFSINGNEYEITRFFGKKKDEDEFELREKGSGKPSTDYSENIGEEIFGIDEDSFERSIFISLSGKTPAMQDSINAKLGNLIDNTDDINNYASAIERLSELAKSLKPLREGGEEKLIKKYENERDKRKREINDAVLAEEKGRETADHISELKEEKKRLDEELSENNERMKLAALRDRFRMYESLKKTLREDEEDCKRLEESFEKNVPSEEELDACEKRAEEYSQTVRRIKEIGECFGDLREINDRIELLKREFPCGFPDDEEISEYRASRRERERVEIEERALKPSEEELSFLKEYDRGEAQNKEETDEIKALRLRTAFKVTSLLAVTIIACLGIFGAGDGIGEKRGILLLAVFLLMAAAFFFTGRAYRKKSREIEAIIEERERESQKLEIRYEAVSQKLSSYEKLKAANSERLKELFSTMESFERAYGKSSLACPHEEGFLRKLSELKDKLDELEKAKKDCTDKLLRQAEYKKMIEAFLLSHGRRVEEGQYFKLISDMRKDRALLLEKRDEERKSRDELESFSKDNDTALLESLGEESFSSLEGTDPSKEQNRLITETERIKRSIEDDEERLEAIREVADRRPELEREYEELSEKTEHLKKKHELLVETMDLLSEAKNNLSTSYMYDMRKAFNKYISMLDNGEQSFNIDNDLDIEVEGGGKNRKSEYLSRGYRDLVNICTRFALIDVMYKNEKPFIILDDPFVNLDEGKLCKALDFIKKLSEERQVIYFVCHPSRCPA
ncbi:MAG: ATP-binding protein [Candidatus Avilachnospira sp.]|jgi:DNA repair exonuclease SbcCD ATPase subunit